MFGVRRCKVTRFSVLLQYPAALSVKRYEQFYQFVFFSVILQAEMFTAEFHFRSFTLAKPNLPKCSIFKISRVHKECIGLKVIVRT